MTHRQRIRLLAGLLCVWAATALAVFGFSPEPRHIPLQNVSGTVGSALEDRDAGSSPGLRVQVRLFENGRSQRAHEFTPPKNIFVSPAEAGATVSLGSAVAAPIADAGLEPMSAPIPADITTPPSELRYLGFVGFQATRGDRAVGVLAQGDELHMVRAGESLDDHREVRRVTPQSVTLFDRNAKREWELPLVDLAPSEASP
ncbi:hypothetical protein YTPLAS18_23850 [Nitrospira sp.]|nr:hypothetical protein YTPLAS18_23850 [Nitrospira sp.]